MKVYEELTDKLKSEKIHMTLIDPASQKPEKSALIAKEASRAGTDYIMLGGSNNIDGSTMDEALRMIKKETDKKIIIFPGSPEMLSEHADAIYFMSLLNSLSTEFIIGYQASVARKVLDFGLETIPMGYIVFEPGMTVGKVGKVSLVGREDVKMAESYALAAELFGMKLVYFESGSGSPTYVSPKVISEVKKKLAIPLIVGGGIRSKEAALEVARAGADIVVTGTVAEKAIHISEILEPIISAVKSVNQ